MFDPESVRADMERLFADNPGGTPGERKPPSASATPIVPARHALRSERPPPARRGMLLTVAFLLAVLVIPLLIIAGSLGLPAWIRQASRIGDAAPVVGRPAIVPQPAPALEPPPRAPSAYVAVTGETAETRRTTTPRRRTRRWARADRAPELAGSALANALAEDAQITKQLNEAAIDRIRPTLPYAPVMDQSAPR